MFTDYKLVVVGQVFTGRRQTGRGVRRFGDVGGDAPGLIAHQQMRRRAASRLLLKIDVGELRYRA